MSTTSDLQTLLRQLRRIDEELRAGSDALEESTAIVDELQALGAKLQRGAKALRELRLPVALLSDVVRSMAGGVHGGSQSAPEAPAGSDGPGHPGGPDRPAASSSAAGRPQGVADRVGSRSTKGRRRTKPPAKPVVIPDHLGTEIEVSTKVKGASGPVLIGDGVARAALLIRRRTGLGQRDFAERMGHKAGGQTFISTVERGKRSLPLDDARALHGVGLDVGLEGAPEIAALEQGIRGLEKLLREASA